MMRSRFLAAAAFWFLVAAAQAQEFLAPVSFKAQIFSAVPILSRDGKILASAGGDERGPGLKIWDVATGREIASLVLPDRQGMRQSIYVLGFDPSGNRLAAAGDAVHLWDLATKRLIRTYEGRPGGFGFLAVAFSSDGKRLAAASLEETSVWDVDSGKKLASLKPHTSDHFAMTLSPDLKTLASGNFQEIDLWDCIGSAGNGRLPLLG